MTFGKLQENQIFEHMFKKESFPEFSGSYVLILMETYPGAWLPCPDPATPGYQPLLLYNTVWGFSHSGKLTNILPIYFDPATGDWSKTVGGWVLVTPIDHERVAAGSTGEPVYLKKWDRVVFAPFSIGFVHNGREAAIRGHFTDYTENALMNHMLHRVDYPTPDIWVGLLTADPTDTGTNANCNEVPLTAGGYQRVHVGPSDWFVPELPDWGWVGNTIPIEFPEATTNWGKVSYVGWFDTQYPSDDGHLLVYGPLQYAWTVTAGSQAKFEVPENWADTVNAGAICHFSY